MYLKVKMFLKFFSLFCDTYNLTSQTEEDDDEEVIRLTRKPSKKAILEGFQILYTSEI